MKRENNQNQNPVQFSAEALLVQAPVQIEKTDLELVEEVRQGHRASFSVLVKRHQRGLLRLSMRFMKDLDSAQDVVQDAFIKAYEKLSLFEGRAAFKSWLYQIAVNTARNKLRENRHQFSDIEDVSIGIDAIAEKGLVHQAVGQMLQKEVDLLPFKQKTALVLRVYEDLSFSEIAQIMECPYDTAKANYRHALLKLKETFETKHELRSWTSEIGGIFTELNTKYAEAE